MINSFWNICSTCPMPKEEKLNSEYKRNYVWHPQYKPLAHEVISCAPQSVVKEIAIQRRKQYPELANRSHEVICHDVGQYSRDVVDSRARSEERDTTFVSKSGPRSRSAEPGLHQQQNKSIMVQSFPPVTSTRVSFLPKTDEIPQIAEHSEATEYQSQFAWPRKTEGEVSCTARKSVSMSIIKNSEDTVDAYVPKSKLAPVHRPCVKHREGLDAEKPPQDVKKKAKTEYKAKYKPFTSYVYVEGEWKKTSRLMKVPEKVVENQVEPWFVEVTERLQRANEYRWRGHGHPVYGEQLPDIYKQPPDIHNHRSKRTPTDLPLNLPKCHQTSSKRSESKRRESQLETVVEKKSEKEPKKQVQRRPKSAEPAKSKETVKYKRPATTPPAKSTSQSLPTRTRMPKVEEVEKAPKRRPKSAEPVKSEPVKTKQPATTPPAKSTLYSLPSRKRLPKLDEVEKVPKSTAPRPARNKAREDALSKKAAPSLEGKVWLQADPPVSGAAGKDDAPLKEHSDAVRPSSLSPLPSTAAPAGDAPPADKVDNAKPVEPQSSVVPLTHVRTPEEVTGVKSPDPENWTVPIENSERLEWSGVNASDIPSRIKSPEISEKPVVADEPAPVEPQSGSSVSSSGKVTSGNVLDRARSRLDQFWGKNK